MSSKLRRKVLKNLEFQPVDDASYGVDDTSSQKPCESGFGQGGDQGAEDKDAGPSHGNIYERTNPVGAVDKINLQDDSENSGTPYKDQQWDAFGGLQDQKTYRRVGACDQHKDHRMIDSSENKIYFLGNIQRVIDCAGGIEHDHTADKYDHGGNSHVTACQNCFMKQGKGTENSPCRPDKMCDGTAWIL